MCSVKEITFLNEHPHNILHVLHVFCNGHKHFLSNVPCIVFRVLHEHSVNKVTGLINLLEQETIKKVKIRKALSCLRTEAPNGAM